MIRPKKSLGQHFLTDHNIARKIADAMTNEDLPLIEIGPGTGMLTKYLAKRNFPSLQLIEIDREATDELIASEIVVPAQLIHADILKVNLSDIQSGQFNVIGNFPYNIGSQIFFKILEHKHQVNSVVCMIQKEVAHRIASPPGSKDYGILSVLLQTYYDIEYLFTVNETVFFPPPKVKSGVIRLTRKAILPSGYDEKFYFKVVKTAFNQRRKMLGNALKSLINPAKPLDPAISQKRAEQLSFEDFLRLSKLLE